MPGPAGTESRWAPAITTLSEVFPGSSAMTFSVSRNSLTASTATRRVSPSRVDPRAYGTPITGMVAPGAPRVPCTTSVRPSCPSLRTTTAEAPAAWALATFWPKGHVPRWTSAMLPAVKPSKSAASQPLVLLLTTAGGGATTSTAWAGAVTAAGAGEVITAEVVASAYVGPSGAAWAEARLVRWENGDSKCCRVA